MFCPAVGSIPCVLQSSIQSSQLLPTQSSARSFERDDEIVLEDAAKTRLKGTAFWTIAPDKVNFLKPRRHLLEHRPERKRGRAVATVIRLRTPQKVIGALR